MDTLSKDVRYGFRSLLKRPASAGIVVIKPALEIGVHTVFFSGINALLLKPLPFSDPDRIVAWYE
jgi:putative ABC transport system permease protein